MQTLKFKITGTTPLLMHRPRLADTLDPLYPEYRKISKKRGKTDDDLARLADLEWEASIYTDAEGRICVPGHAIQACIRDGGKTRKLGSKIQESTTVFGNPVLKYTGSKDIEKLRDNPSFRLRRFLKVQRQGVMRTWPQFTEWSLEFEIRFPEDVFDPQEIADCVEIAGSLKGMLESRTRGYGRFVIDHWEEAA